MHLEADASPQEEIYAPHPDISSVEVSEDILFQIELHSQLEYREKGEDKQNGTA
jgi:hypothetical protein